MTFKLPFTWPSFILSSVAILASMFIIMMLGLPSSEWAYTNTVASTSGQAMQKTGIWLPVLITISKIKVSAVVESLWLTRDGAMDTTKGAYDVAWFNLGPRPGQTGSAVIAWHYGIWKNGAISVFEKLNTLRKGDKVSIKDSNGKIITFIVRESKLYKIDADATNVFSSSDGKAHLNLITCVWDKVSKTYYRRLVVFTDKE